jgi:hypothetical protein
MAEAAKAPLIEVARSDPALWIERLVLFRNASTGAVIRDLSFRRGLNLIWGVAQEVTDDEDESFGVLSGHSVGKTALCRLIRYCLGEEAFGRQTTVKQVRQQLPKAAVGMELHVAGFPWTVVRSLGGRVKFSRAAKGRCMETLLANQKDDEGYLAFLDSLRSAFLTGLPAAAPPASTRPYEWGHLLAWMTRDQEVRFQNLWEWRSPRSESSTTAFVHRKLDAVYLMRMALDVLTEAEDARRRERAALVSDLEDIEKKLPEMRREPADRARRSEEDLRRLLGPKHQPSGEGPLFGLEAQVAGRIQDLKADIVAAEGDREKVEKSLSAKQVWLQRVSEDLARQEAGSNVTAEGTEAPEEKDDVIRELRELYDKTCVYGGVEFKDCEHYSKKWEERVGNVVSLSKAREERRERTVTEERAKAVAAMDQKRGELSQLAEELRRRVHSDEQARKQLDDTLASLRVAREALENHRRAWQEAEALREGRTPNTELEEAQTKVAELRARIEEQEREIGNLQQASLQKADALGALYQRVLRRVLTEDYAGGVEMTHDDLVFSIRESAGLSGEAVETLALVLADITSALWGAAGHGYHPGFVLHDSPREADLDPHVYARLLRVMRDIGEELGGETAPFQYIVTTTTKPPKSLIEDGTVRVKLQAHPEDELLYRCVLNAQTPLALSTANVGEEV